MYIDISHSTSPSYGGAKYWGLIVDGFTRYKWSVFISTKDSLLDAVCGVILNEYKLKNNIKFIRLDNAGEHTHIKSTLIEYGLNNVRTEYTAPRTPQKNGLVERGFGFLYGRVRASLNGLNLSAGLKNYSGLSALGT